MRNLPPGWLFDGDPHYVNNADDGCASYYRVWVKTAAGRVVTCGVGANPEAARHAAVRAACDLHEFEQLPDRQRLWHYIDRVRKERGGFYQPELVDIVEILARAVLPREAK